MDKKVKKIVGIFIRYAVILLAGVNIHVFNAILSTPTIKVFAFVLRPFFDIVVANNFIYARGVITQIAPSCLVGQAFFVLFMLVFATADLKPKRRLAVLAFSFTALFVLNIARMFVLILIIHKPYFNTAHWIGQYIASTVFVVSIWIAAVHLLKIMKIPFYSDLKSLYSLKR